MKLQITILLLLGFTVMQAEDKQSVRELVTRAQVDYNYDNFHSAIKLLDQALAQAPQDVEALYLQGVCYGFLEELDSTYKYLSQISPTDINNVTQKGYYFWMGKANHFRQNWDAAINKYTEYSKTIPEDDARKTEVDTYIKQCKTGKALSARVIPMELRHLGNHANGSFEDFNALMTSAGNKMYFTSIRPKGKSKNGLPREEIMITEKDQNGKWTPAHLVDGPLHHEHFIVCLQLFDSDKKMLIQKPNHNGNLYISSHHKNGWHHSHPLKEINTKGVESDGWISEQGDHLIFSSNGYNGGKSLDLYESRLKADGHWSTPSPLSSINSDFEETNPRISPDGDKLYFASNSEQSMGGFDIFYCNKTSEGWSAPKNCGFPINSTGDDISYTLNPMGDIGYVSSKRMGHSSDLDIYMVTPIVYTKLTGSLKDDHSHQIVSDKSISVSAKSTSQSLHTFQTKLKVSGGSYYGTVVSDADYIIEVKKGREIIYTETYHVDLAERQNALSRHDLAFQWEEKTEPMPIFAQTNTRKSHFPDPMMDPDQIIETTPEPLMASASPSTNDSPSGKSSPTPTRSIEPVMPKTPQELVQEFAQAFNKLHFDYNSTEVNGTQQKKLQELAEALQGRSDIRIEIVGHTDSKGSDEYNLNLSEKRAASVKDMLISSGFAANQVSHKGAGEALPIVAENSEAAKMLNRRVEFFYYVEDVSHPYEQISTLEEEEDLY